MSKVAGGKSAKKPKAGECDYTGRLVRFQQRRRYIQGIRDEETVDDRVERDIPELGPRHQISLPLLGKLDTAKLESLYNRLAFQIHKIEYGLVRCRDLVLP